jgi:hypothetical protein
MRLRAQTIGIVSAAFLGGTALAGFVAAKMPFGDRPSGSDWAEMNWPFPMDPWGPGRAFHCGAASCGQPIDLFVRAKVGFCNCTTGVSDDDELDRVGDFDLMGADAKPISEGRRIDVGKGVGRERLYVSGGSGKQRQTALSFAFNNECDAVVVTALTSQKPPADFEAVILRFATGNGMRQTVAGLLSRGG